MSVLIYWAWQGSRNSDGLPRQQKATAFGRGRMRQRLAGMSPHWGVKYGAMGFARGAPQIL